MRILFLSPRQCWPAVSGAKLREYFLARALGGGGAVVTHISFTPAGAEPLSAASLPFCDRIISVPQPRAYTARKIARGIFGCYPLPVLNYTSREMFAALSGVMRDGKFDLVHLESIHMIGYADLLRRAGPIVYNWHNIESEAMRRYAAQARSPFRSRYAAHTAGRLEALEHRILAEASGHLVCSERERQQLLSIAGEARIAVVENGVDTTHFAEAAAGAHPRRRVVFVGQMSYHANIDAILAFARQVWPRLSRRFPAWTLTIVGSNPSPAVSALAQLPNVEVTGTVPDVRPYYSDAVAAVVPLRVGGGTRLKILEAMAAGVPVVSTPLGAEGLAVSPGDNILIADADGDWDAQLEALSRDPVLWRRLSAAGRALARDRYDWRILGNALCETYRQWLMAARR
jgi:glycosyltransferase involved in cell wall biosynthesis